MTKKLVVLTVVMTWKVVELNVYKMPYRPARRELGGRHNQAEAVLRFYSSRSFIMLLEQINLL